MDETYHRRAYATGKFQRHLLLTFYVSIITSLQKHIQNPVQRLSWSFLGK